MHRSSCGLFAAVRQRTLFRPVLQDHIIKCLGIYGTDIQRPSTSSSTRTSWVVICRGQNRFVEGLPHIEPGPNPTSKELLRERELLQKKTKLLLQSWTNPSSRKLMRCRNWFLRIPCTVLFLLEKGSGLIFPPTNSTRKMLFQPKSQNWWKDSDIMIKMKEKLTALFIGGWWDENCEMLPWSMEVQNSQTWIGSNTSLGEAAR